MDKSGLISKVMSLELLTIETPGTLEGTNLMRRTLAELPKPSGFPFQWCDAIVADGELNGASYCSRAKFRVERTHVTSHYQEDPAYTIPFPTRW